VSRSRDNVALNVKRIRQAQGLTQEDLAARARLTPKTIYRIESRLSAPSWETLQLLADGLGVAADALMADQPAES
jgi:transcriptional regulator with XRE-family HTH domain